MWAPRRQQNNSISLPNPFLFHSEPLPNHFIFLPVVFSALPKHCSSCLGRVTLALTSLTDFGGCDAQERQTRAQVCAMIALRGVPGHLSVFCACSHY